MLHLLYLAGLDRSRHLPPDSTQTFPDVLRHRLHIVGLEVAGQRRQDGVACRGGIGIGNGNAPISQKRMKTIIVSGLQ